MNDTDQTCLGLFFLSLVFWLMTTGFSLNSLAEATQLPRPSHHVEALLGEK